MRFYRPYEFRLVSSLTVVRQQMAQGTRKSMRDHTTEQNDRPIDHRRDGAGQAIVEGDVGSILMVFPHREARLFFICERGVTSGQMADQIDPERTIPTCRSSSKLQS